MTINTIQDLRERIEKEKEELRTKAEENGIWENFGQDRIRKIEDDLNLGEVPYKVTADAQSLIDQFGEWCKTFDLG